MSLIDQSVLNFFAENRVEWLSFIMLVITYSGSYVLIGGLTILSALSFYIHRHTARALSLLISVGGSAVTVFILKNIFYRARPLLGSVYLESSSSFPSGHATMVMALYGFLFYIIWKSDVAKAIPDKHEKYHLKNLFIVFLSILIPLVGLSRLYLGVHYLSDVLTGYTIGFVWILISIYFAKKVEKLIWRV